MSIAEKTHNQVFRVLAFSTGTRLGKIAIFSLKSFGLFTKNFRSSILSEIVSQTHIGVVIDVVKFTFFRLSIAEKTHNEAFRVLQFLPGPRLGKIAIFH